MNDDEFESWLSRRFRAYLAAAVDAVDTSAAAKAVIDRSPERRRWWGALESWSALGIVALTAAILILGLSPATVGPLATGSPSRNALATDLTSLPAETPAITAPLSERERSDAFWAAVSDFAPTAFRYANLQEITEDAHLIVAGRVTGIELGSVQPFEPGLDGVRRPTVFGVFTIDEVLKGKPATSTPGKILVARLGVESTGEDDLPAEQVILFLKNYAQMREEEGVPQASDAADAFHYVRPNGYQCVLRSINGEIEIVDGPPGWQQALGPFPAGLAGDRTEDVISRIREFVSGRA